MLTKPTPKTFRQVFPELADSDVVQAEANFEAYLALIIRIHDRISRDPVALAELRAALALKRQTNDDGEFDRSPQAPYDCGKGRCPQLEN